MNCHYHPEVPSAAFCQFCGKPLCKDCVRNVGGAVYCESCLAERLRTAGAPPAAGFSTGVPHPFLAGLLGLIPGVGAMYNAQYAKAIAHVLIFAVLTSLSDHSGIFGILVAAWVFYQVFDAYQTAIARRDGLPLPNPFGLNDIAQRLGIHPNTGFSGPGVGVPPVPPVPPAPGASWEPVGSAPPPAAGFVPGDSAAGQGGYTPVGQQPYPPPTSSYPPGSPYPGQSYPGYVPPVPQLQRDLPIGAILLIGLGVLFLFGSLGILRENWAEHSWPLLIIGLGVWVIIRRARSVPPSDPNGGVR